MISCDIDGVLADFYNPYINRFGIPKSSSEITKNVMRKLSKDKDFWMNLPKINTLDWTPKRYTTARIISKKWVKEYLDKEGFPKAPVYQVLNYNLSKYKYVKGCDLHIDDSLSVFFDLNLKGFPCLLYTNNGNLSWGDVGRIHTLNLDEIELAYNSILKINFKELYNDYRRLF